MKEGYTTYPDGIIEPPMSKNVILYLEDETDIGGLPPGRKGLELATPPRVLGPLVLQTTAQRRNRAAAAQNLSRGGVTSR